MRCEHCNAIIKDNAKFCFSCGNKVELSQVKDNKKSNRPFVLSEDEVEIKTYNCTTFDKPFAQGYIAVTNKRVIYYAFGKSSKLFSEVYINKISGVSSYYGTGHNKNYLRLAILPAIISFIGYKSKTTLATYASYGYEINSLYNNLSKGAYWIGLLAVIICIGLYLFKKQLMYKFSILSEGADGRAISIGVKGGDLTGQGAAIATQVIPTNEAHVMMKELGAMILDFKNLGNHAIDIWKDETNQSDYSNNENITTSLNEESIFS